MLKNKLQELETQLSRAKSDQYEYNRQIDWAANSINFAKNSLKLKIIFQHSI